MEVESFRRLEIELETCFVNQDFQAGIELVDKYLPTFEDNSAALYLWKIYFLVSENKFDDAIKTLAKSLAKGYWFSKYILMEDSKLKKLHALEEYARVVEISAKMEEVEAKNFLPQLVIRPKNGCNPQEPGCPLFYFLHDNDDQALNHLPQWHSLSNQGWIIGMPQSNVTRWVGAYYWRGIDQTKIDLQKKITGLHLQYSVDVNRVVMGGYGKGGELAFEYFLKNEIIGNGFILINPTESILDNNHNLEKIIEKNSNKNKKCIIAADKNNFKNMNKLHQFVEKLNMNAIDTELKLLTFSTMQYPELFGTEISGMINFLTK